MYTTRAANPAEASELLTSLWRQNLPVAGALDDKLRWFYCEGPHGAGSAFVVTTPEASFGCAGIGVRRLGHNGLPLRAALFADLAVERSHRSGLPALALLRSV